MKFNDSAIMKALKQIKKFMNKSNLEKFKESIKKIPFIKNISYLTLTISKRALYFIIGFIYMVSLNYRYNKTVFVVGYDGLGDYMYALRIAQYIREKSNFKIHVLVTKSKKIENMLEFYEFLDFTIAVKSELVVCSINFVHTHVPFLFRKRNKFVSYNLEGNYSSYPNRLLMKYNVIKEPSYLINDLYEYTPRISKQKILISPYSNTIKIEVEFFNKLVNDLANTHFEIEIIGKAPLSEENFNGAKHVDLSIGESIAYARESMMIIGVRSGYMEFLLQAKIPIVFLHKNYDYFPSNSISNYLIGVDLPFKEIDLNENDYASIFTQIREFIYKVYKSNS
jgi:hypothetical protein